MENRPDSPTGKFWQTSKISVSIPKKPSSLVPNYKLEMNLRKSCRPKFNVLCKGGGTSLKIEEVWAARHQADQS